MNDEVIKCKLKKKRGKKIVFGGKKEGISLGDVAGNRRLQRRVKRPCIWTQHVAHGHLVKTFMMLEFQLFLYLVHNIGFKIS